MNRKVLFLQVLAQTTKEQAIDAFVFKNYCIILWTGFGILAV